MDKDLKDVLECLNAIINSEYKGIPIKKMLSGRINEDKTLEEQISVMKSIHTGLIILMKYKEDK